MIKKTIEYIKIPKKVFYTLLIIIVLLITFNALKPNTYTVDVSSLQQGLFQKKIIEEGFTEFTQKQIINAPADGISPHINLKEGDQVKKGQILLSFKWDQEIQITAPFDGSILKIFEKDQRHVPRGTPLLEIGNSDDIKVVANILSEEVVEVTPGQKVSIRKWGKEQELDAEVIKIESAANEVISALGVKEKRVKVHIKLLSKREVWNSLGDGFRVEVIIVTKESDNSLLLPVGALFNYDGMPSIYLVNKKDRLKLINVKVGAKNDEFVQLFSDVPLDSNVVMYPGSFLEDGIKVKIRK
ncbi:HlyD family efflux transporter periplasmic adaptor subunit [Bacteriovoracaceae bacterium]|nr:HlyD family efflux transporter periplasmic adaptor subunit [Bacteriovoracaceae bacterium]